MPHRKRVGHSLMDENKHAHPSIYMQPLRLRYLQGSTHNSVLGMLSSQSR